MIRKIYNRVTHGFMALLSDSMLENISDELLRLRIRTQEKLRQQYARKNKPLAVSIVSHHGQVVSRSVLEKRAPWSHIAVPDSTIPGMLTLSEKQYYLYITQFYKGDGAIVELGPWLGLSTYYLATGLQQNPRFAGKYMSVFDDFVWRESWMKKWLQGTTIVPPKSYASFEALFNQQTANIAQFLEVKRQKIADYDGNQTLPQIKWLPQQPIELIIVDCGRTLSVNEAWWDIFSPSFIKGKTLIVMQDWQNHKAVPEMFWENTKIFTDSKQHQIELVHEVAQAGIATFLYRG